MVEDYTLKANTICMCMLVTQSVKNLPAMQETWVRSQGWKDPLEKEMTTHSSILAWKIPWTEEPGGLQSRGHKESGTTEQLTFFQRHMNTNNHAVVQIICINIYFC